ncbi:MAG: hypothetical protein QW348_02615 [Ignisphaera sp.]
MDRSRMFLVVVLLIDSFLWGIWFGGLWSYRLAFASRLTDDYIQVSASYALPLFVSSISFLVALKRPGFFRLHRIALFKLSAALSRVLYMATAIVVLTNVLSSLKLLYATTALFSIASLFGNVAAIAWTDYIADNIPDDWKPRYIALDSLLGTLGALAGSIIAGYIFAFETGVRSYGRLFLLVSAIFLLDMPLIIMLKDIHKNVVQIDDVGIRGSRPSPLFYIAIVVLYLALNLPTALTAPYIIYRLGGDELWITAINISNFVASILMPIAFSEVLRRVDPLSLAGISIAVAAISTAIFPQLKTVELQIVRAFAAGAGGIGIWMSIISHMISDVDPGNRIQHSSTVYLIQNIVPAIATSIGGLLADVLKSPEVVFYMSATAIASIPAITRYRRRSGD